MQIKLFQICKLHYRLAAAQGLSNEKGSENRVLVNKLILLNINLIKLTHEILV